MSAGVSDQRMKGQGNQVINSTSKNVEKDDRFIPWSQQVDDAPYEPVPSPTEGSQTGTYGSSSHNNFQKNGDYYNSWSSQCQQQQSQQINNASQNRKSNNYDEYYRSDRGSYQNDNVKVMQRGMQNMSLDGRNDDRSSNATNTNADRDKPSAQTSSAPKQMTWASIASQPAKQPLRSNRFTSSSSSTLKKKGPGMPPPPMVPGKHNMDIGTWDSPKNGPQLVPPPPPPVIPVPIMEPPTNQNKHSSNNSNNRQPRDSGNVGSGGSGNASANNAPQNKQGFNNQPNRNYNQNVSSNNSSNNNNNMRPSWADRDPPPHVAKNMEPRQNQRPNMHEGQSNSTSRQSSREDYSIHRNDHPHPPQSVSPLPPAHSNYPPQAVSPALSNTSSNYAVLEELRDKNNYNPPELDLETAADARFFVIKSYSEDDIHRSIKYGIWCSTEHGNKRLDQAFHERQSANGNVCLFFSVNGSRHFCGMAYMQTPVDYNSVSNVWSQTKWKGTFKVKWVYVKDVPNGLLRHIRLENNENKSVTHSRDTQEVPNAKGIQVLQVLHTYKHTTSIFDDFFHYEKLQEEGDSKKYEPPAMRAGNNYDDGRNMSPPGKPLRGGSGDRDREYGKGFNRSGDGGGGFRDKGFNRGGGGYHGGYENRRYDDRGGPGFDRERDRDRGRDRDRYPRDGPGSGNFNNARGDNRDRDNSGDDYNRGGGFYRNDFRRDDRDRGFNRDRDRDRENFDEGFMSRNSDSGRGGGFNRGDQYNRDRGEHNRGRGRMGQRN